MAFEIWIKYENLTPSPHTKFCNKTHSYILKRYFFTVKISRWKLKENNVKTTELWNLRKKSPHVRFKSLEYKCHCFVAYASISEVLGRCLHNSYVLARRASVFDSKEQKDKNFYLAFPNLEILQVKLKLLWIRKGIKHLEKLHNTTKTNPPVKLRKEVWDWTSQLCGENH